MNKIIITPGITDLNRGDQALIWLIKDVLEDYGLPVNMKLLQSGNNKHDIYMQSKQSTDMQYDVMAPLLLHPARGKENESIAYSFSLKLRWGLIALKDLINSSMLLSKNKTINKLAMKKLKKEQRKTYNNFKNMDLMIVKGGGFLHTYNRLTDIYYLYYSLYNIMLADRLGKKVVIMPNSFGPFLGKLEQAIVKKVLNKVELIYAREDISKKYLQNVLRRKVYLSSDLGFFISSNKNKSKYNENIFTTDKKKVAITMRPYRFPEYSDSSKRYENYINEMYKVSKELINRGYYPVFVAHTLGPSAHEDDRISLKEVIEKLQKAGVANKDYSYIDNAAMNCYDLANLYSKVDYIIGTRFHSVIFAMTSLKPAIAISYSGHKTTGIMKDMGLEKYVVEIGEIDSEVMLKKFDNLIDETDIVREKIKQYLDKCETNKMKMLRKIKTLL